MKITMPFRLILRALLVGLAVVPVWRVNAAVTTFSYASPVVVTDSAIVSTSGSASLTVTGTAWSVGDVIRFNGTSSSTNPFGTSATRYYVVSVSGSTIQVSASPGGSPLNASNSTTASTSQQGQDWFTGGNWTGGSAPTSGSGTLVTFAGSAGGNNAPVVFNGNATVYGLTNNNGGATDLTLVSGGTGTGLYTLTFATNDGSTPYMTLNYGNFLTFLGTSSGGNMTLKIAGNQGLIINSMDGGAVTSGTSALPNKNLRINNVDWSGFSGGIVIERGELGPQASNQLPVQSLTIGDAQSVTNNQLAGLASTTAQTIDALNGNSYGRLYGAFTLTVGSMGGSGSFGGNIGVNFAGTAFATAITKTGTGTQTFSGLLYQTGTTTVTAGTLNISGTHAPAVGSDFGAYLVSAPATLGGSGTIRPSSNTGSTPMISVSGTLAPGTGGIGTLTLDGTNSVKPLLSCSSGAVLRFDLGAGGTGDKVMIVNSQSGDVTFNSNVINFSDLTAGSLTSGTYVLFHGDLNSVYSGLTTDGTGGITAGLNIGSGLSNYTSASLQKVGGDIILNLGNSIVAGTPSGIAVSISGTQVTVSWLASANTTYYSVYRSTTPNGSYVMSGTTSGLSYVDPGVSNGVTYYYKITATGGGNESLQSAAVAGTAFDPNTTSIIGVHLRAYNTYGMAVSDLAGVVRAPYWNNLLGPVVQGETTLLSNVMNQFGVPVSGMSVAWAAGTTGVSYNNGGTIKTGSDSVTNTPATNDPNLFASVFDQYNTTASTLAVAGIPYSSYDAIFYIYDGGSSRGGSITIGSTTYYIRGGAGSPAADGTGYVQSDDTSFGAGTDVVQGNYVRFSGLSGSSLSASFVAQNLGDSTQRLKVAGFQIVSHDAVSLPAQAPAAPSGLSATTGNQQVGLNWSASATATAYKIYRGSSYGSYSLLTGGTVVAPVTSYADITAGNGVTYYYAVSAVNSIGEGAQTTGTVSATPATPSFTMPQRTVYQWSLPMAPIYSGTAGTFWAYDPQRRAYLWVPPGCARVQGVMVGLHNMLEKPMFDDPAIRQACADAGIAILFIAPGDAGVWTPNGLGNYTSTGPASMAITLDPNSYYSQDIVSGTTHYATDINPATGTRFANQSEQAGAELANLLTQFAVESGYDELQYAPVLLTDHSAGSPFCWGRTVPSSAALTGRVFAILPNKGTFPGNISNLPGIPIFHVASEYQEISDWGNTWELGDAPAMRGLRGGGINCLIGECVQPGSGHYEYLPEQASPLAAFIRAAASARIPSNWSPTGYPTLNPIDPTSGWVIDVRYMGSGTCQTVSYATWVASGNDPLRAYWYPDQTTAQAVCDTANAGFSKKPQMISAFQNSSATTPAALGSLNSGGVTGVGYVPCSPTLQGDGVTFQVRAASINQSPIPRLYNGSPQGIASGPILFRANGSGSMKQTGADTFRVWLDRESVVKGGQPWEPFILAYQPGDSNYRSAYRPIQILTSVAVNLISGSTQTITFPALPDVTGTNLQQITLSGSLAATAGSGLPVQYWVVAGPYRNDENNSSILIPDSIPAGSKFPMRVVIGAWQWGRPSSVGTAVQSAAPVFQTFWINQTAVNNWRYDYFGTYSNSGSAADTANPAGDGIVNLMKYAMGMSPLIHSSNPPVVPGRTTVSGSSYLTLTFNRIADPALTYSVEASTDLSGITDTWHSVWSSSGASNTAVTGLVVQDIVAVGSQMKRFLRLRVSY